MSNKTTATPTTATGFDHEGYLRQLWIGREVYWWSLETEGETLLRYGDVERVDVRGPGAYGVYLWVRIQGGEGAVKAGAVVDVCAEDIEYYQ